MVERLVRGEDDDDEEIMWNVSTDVRYSSSKATGAIFIKKFNQIETDKSLPKQMRIITLSEDSPYETLHSYLSCAVSPFFKVCYFPYNFLIGKNFIRKFKQEL